MRIWLSAVSDPLLPPNPSPQPKKVPIKTAVVGNGYCWYINDWPGVELTIPGQRVKDEVHRQADRKNYVGAA